MILVDLNEDVLRTITSLLSCHDALILSTTSRQIHSIALDRAHSEVRFVKPGPERINNMCRYMLSDSPRRPLRLRTLELSYDAFRTNSEEDDDVLDLTPAALIVDLLEQAVGLRKLRLPLMDRLMEQNVRIGDAVAALTNLSHIALGGIGLKTAGVLNRLCSAPQSISLSSPVHEDLGELLRSISPIDSVRSIEFKYFRPKYALQSTAGLVSEICLSKQWPNVTSISLINDFFPMAVHAHLFPNIQTVIMNSAGMDREARNNDITWSHLSHVIGFPNDLHFSGIMCRTDTVEFSGLIGLSDSYIRGHVLHAVRNLAPVTVTLAFNARQFIHGSRSINIDITFWQDLVNAVPRLQNLVVVISGTEKWQHPDGPPDLPSWLESLPHAFDTSSVTCIQICFDKRHFAHILDARNTDSSFTDVKTVQAFPEQFAKNVPSLEYFSLAEVSLTDSKRSGLKLRTYEKSFWWKVTNVEGARTARTLSAAEGGRVHEMLLETGSASFGQS